MQAQKESKPKPNKPTPNSNLLQFQKPIYELKRNEQGKVESIIAKLMQNKDKPQIGFTAPSPLLDQLRQFMPILKQSNNLLLQQEIKPEQRIDAKLETVQDSSSESESEANEENEQNEKSNEGQMIDEANESQQPLQSCDQFEFNILTYPYLNAKQEVPSDKEHQNQTTVGRSSKIVEVEDCSNPINELERME